MTRRFLMIVLVSLAPSIFALPQVAVLDAVIEEDMDPGVSIAVADKISESLVNSAKYTVLDRAGTELVLREKEFQLSGLVKTEEIRRAGEYLGADFVVAARAARIGDTYFVSARMIDVKTGVIAAQASVEREGRIAIILGIAGAVGDKLAGGIVESVENRRLEGPVRRQPQTPAPAPKPTAPTPAPAPTPGPAAPAAAPAAARAGAVHLGVKGGMSSADVFGDDAYETTTPATRWLGGGFMNARFGEVGAEIDVLYAQKGFDWDFDDLGVSYHQEWVFDYIDTAVIGKLYAGSTSPLYILVGVALGVFMGGNVLEEFSGTSTDYTLEDLFDIAALNLEGLLGLGMDLPAGKALLNLDIRLGMGLNSWMGGDGSLTPKHMTLSIMGGIGFGN